MLTVQKKKQQKCASLISVGVLKTYHINISRAKENYSINKKQNSGLQYFDKLEYKFTIYEY